MTRCERSITRVNQRSVAGKTDFGAAAELGVRDTFHEEHVPLDRPAVFAEFAQPTAA
jgi:hypothetical protein